MSVVILTKRLELRRWTLLDIPYAVPIYTDPVVMEYMGPRALTSQAVERGIRATITRYETHGIGFLAMTARESGEILGHCGVQVWEGTTDIEMGWLLASPRWGNGYATEAATAVREWAFANLEVPRLVAVAREENLRSIALMERIGMTCVGPRNYKGTDVVLYAINRPPR